MMNWDINSEVRSTLGAIPHHFVAGKVTRVIGLIVEGVLPHAPVGGVCAINTSNGEKVEAEVIGIKGQTVVLMPIGPTSGIRAGDFIETIQSQAMIKASIGLLGRVIDGYGNPIDGGAPIEHQELYPLYREPVPSISRKVIQESLPLGVRALDGMLTCGIGQRMVIMAGSGVGKSTLMGMSARNTIADVNVIGLIGERGREVREFIERDLGPEGLKRSVVVVATSDAPALMRMRAAFVTTTIAEYFRDKGLNVLLMMDSLTRFAMASREVGLSLGEPPTVKGYTPSLFSTLPKLLERVGNANGEGSITGLYTVLTEGDDIQDPIADAVRAIVDGHIVLSRKLTAKGHYPPIDVLESISRLMTQVTSPEQQAAAQKIRHLLSLYNDMEDYIKIGVYSPGKNQELDMAVNCHEAINQFLKQKYDEPSSFKDTVNWMQRIANGEVTHGV